MSPIVRPFTGQTIPCGHRPRVCDAYGHELGLAALPFDGQTLCHDGCGQAIFDMLREARLHYIAEPRDMFASVIPIRQLMRRDEPCNIIPDAAVDMSLPPVATARHARQGPPEPRRRHLVDFKTIYSGGGIYREPRAPGGHRRRWFRGIKRSSRRARCAHFLDATRPIPCAHVRSNLVVS